MQKNTTKTSEKQILKLRNIIIKNEIIRLKLIAAAKKLALVAKHKEITRRKLAAAAKKLALVAKHKEIIRRKLAAAAKKLVLVAKNKKIAKHKLTITTKKLNLVIKEKEVILKKLVTVTQDLAFVAHEKEIVIQKLLIVTKRLNLIAQQKKKVGIELINSSKKLAINRMIFEQLFENMNSGSVIYKSVDNGKDFILKNFNRSAERIEKIKRKDVIGKKLSKVFSGVKNFGLFAVLQRVWKTGKPEHFPISLYADERVSGWRDNYVYRLPNGDIVSMYDDVTNRKKIEYDLIVSELRYRRLFETARDGVLLIDFKTGMILDVNPYLVQMLSYSKKDFLKKYLWEVGVFKDIAASKRNFATLQEKRYVRFEDLPLETKYGRRINVEFVANAYKLDGTQIIQCNIRDITDRKKAEKLLIQSEDKFSKAFQTSPYAISITRIKDGKFLDINNAFLLISGYNRREVLANSSIGLKVWANKEDRMKVMADISIGRPVISREYKFQMKNGSIRFGLFSAQTIKLDGEDCLLSSISDITDRKVAEEKLLKSEKRYHNIFEHSQDALMLLNKKGFFECNQVTLKVFGYENVKDFCNKHPWQISPSIQPNGISSKKLANECIEEAYKKGSNLFEWVHQRKNGQNFPASVLLVPLELNGEKVIQATVRDITVRKRAEEALHESEERFHRSFEASQNGLLLINKSGGGIINFNKSAHRLLGYSESEFLKKRIWDIGVIKNESDFKKALLILEKENAIHYRDIPIKNRVGNIIDTDVFLIGGPKFIQCSIRDMAEEKEIEKLRNDFLSLASHQLRTPLSGIKWLIETMIKGTIGEMTNRQKEYLDDIYKVNEQMIKLVSDILNTLRLGGVKALVKNEKISVHDLLEDVLSLVKAAANRKKMIIEAPSDHRKVIIETDVKMLESIIGSFLSNAIDYSIPGGKIILGVEEKFEKIIFFVHDFGIGIPEREQKRIFERFYRASNAKNWRPAGTGLGLNISKMLAEKINGEITFESKNKKGTTFYLRIPKRSNGIKKVRKNKYKK
jgi:PAS domain S-box-containing protein